jgi:hypothetical protein
MTKLRRIGNGDGLGTIRAKELKDSCRELGIMEEENCIALNDPSVSLSLFPSTWEASIRETDERYA